MNSLWTPSFLRHVFVCKNFDGVHPKKKHRKKKEKQHLMIAWHVTTWSVQFANKKTTPTWFVQNVKVTSNDWKNSPAASLLKEKKWPETVSFGFKKSYPSRFFASTLPKTEIAPTNGVVFNRNLLFRGSMLVSGSVSIDIPEFPNNNRKIRPKWRHGSCIHLSAWCAHFFYLFSKENGSCIDQ